MRFDDSKYLAQSVERSRVKLAERVSGDDLSSIRGIGEAKRREVQALLPDAEGCYEPVTFQHPATGRKVYGWLVAVDGDGNAQVEVGDGEYAVIPPTEIRRLGHKEDRAKIQADLKRVMGTFSTETDGLGVRADFQERSSLTPLSADDETLKLLTLSYAATLGDPTEAEVSAYVARFYPTAEIVDSDGSMPGRIGIAIRIADDRAAEMGAAHGGEVQEVLDPEDVVDTEADPGHSHDQVGEVVGGGHTKEAIWPFNKQTPQVSAGEAAKELAESRNESLIEQVMKVFMDNGGGRAFARSQGGITLPQALAMAMPVVKRADPGLWGKLSQMTLANMSARPAQPENDANANPGRAAPGNSLGNPTAPTTPVPPQDPNAPSTEDQSSAFGAPGPQMSEVMDEAQQLPGSSPGNQLGQPQKPFKPNLNPQPPQMHASAGRHADLRTKTSQVAPGQPGQPGQPGSQMQNAVQQLQQSQPGVGNQPNTQVPQQGPFEPNLSGAPPSGTGPLVQPMYARPQYGADTGAPAPGVSSAEGVNVTSEKGGTSRSAAVIKPTTMEAARRSALFGDATPPSEKRVEQGYSHLTSQGLPPSMTEIFNTMKVWKFARRGDYVFAEVQWAPSAMHGRTAHAVMNTVKTFVVAKCGAMRQGANFGIMGKVYVLELDQDKGTAKIQFASEFQGPATTVVRTE